MKRFHVIDDNYMLRPEDIFRRNPVVEAETAQEAIAKYRIAVPIRKAKPVVKRIANPPATTQ